MPEVLPVRRGATCEGQAYLTFGRPGCGEVMANTVTQRIAKVFDWPPVWLAVSLLSVWSLGQLLPFALIGRAGQGVGLAFGAAGLALMGIAAAQMWRARTTVIPHSTPTALVSSGVFRFSRNPIYLGDVLVLLGAVFYFDALVGIILVPLFMKVIEKRFIFAEEAGLKAAFGESFDIWAAAVRRWV